MKTRNDFNSLDEFKDYLRKRHYKKQHKRCKGGKLCKYGGKKGREVDFDEFQLDRKRPGALRGEYDWKNTQGLCSDCNKRKGKMNYIQWSILKKIGAV